MPPAIPGRATPTMLAEAAGVSDVAMMFVGGGLRVALLTIHCSLRSVPTRSRAPRRSASSVLVCHRELPRLGAEAKRIAVCGLNPHAGERGLFGDEETSTIAPAFERAREPGDRRPGRYRPTRLPARAPGEFDAVLALYHDQGLIPLKILAFERA